MTPATFHTVVGICSALFTPDYPVEDKMHKAQACEVFQQYCTDTESYAPTVQSEYQPYIYRSGGSVRRKQRREP